MHNLEEDIPTLKNFFNLITAIQIRPEVKEAESWSPVLNTALIARIFQPDNEFQPNLLREMMKEYIFYGRVFVYKIKTRKALLLETQGSEVTYAYKDGHVAGLEVIHDEEAYLDEDIKNGLIKGLQLDRISSILGSRHYLKRAEFIYSTDWNPEKNRSITSVGKMLDWAVNSRHGYTPEDISPILGVDNDLVFAKEISDERKAFLIRRAIDDTIVPLASQFITNIKYDLGINLETMRLTCGVAIDTSNDEAVIDLWENGYKQYIDLSEISSQSSQENTDLHQKDESLKKPEPQDMEDAEDIEDIYEIEEVEVSQRMEEISYCIFNRDGVYQVSEVEWPERPDALPGEYTGWSFSDEDQARKVAHVLNNLKDPLAVKYFFELAEIQF